MHWLVSVEKRDKKSVLFFSSLLFNKKALLMLNNATAHLAAEFLIMCAANSSKSFLINLIFVALDNFTFGIVTSVSNIAK